MPKLVTTFPALCEYEKAVSRLEELGLPHETVSAAPGYARVGAGAVILEAEVRMELESQCGADFVTSGWVEHYPEEGAVPAGRPAEFEDPVFDSCAIMVLAPCVADRTKIRVTAHVAGDLAPAFPYMNAEMPSASYNPNRPSFTFLDGYRMVALYPGRITIAKADGFVDAWRALEGIRARTNETWARRGKIEPSYEMRERPPALEIYRRLPRTNCRACGEKTCLAFAAKLWQGQARLEACGPVFGGDRGELRDALLDICAGLGVSEPRSVAARQ
jgi:ArsR family metal-binding transcriptional regulator